MEEQFQPRIDFEDLLGVSVKSVSGSELSLEFVAEGVTTHVKICNAQNPLEAVDEGGFYFFGLYGDRTMAVRYLGESSLINRDCKLFGAAVNRSFSDQDISFLPIHVTYKDKDQALFYFTFGEYELYKITCTNGSVDITQVSKY